MKKTKAHSEVNPYLADLKTTVDKLRPTERMFYWMLERHMIHCRRKLNYEKPWTNDKIMQQYFFTNPYRENDKTTIWFRDHVRGKLQNSPAVLMATIIARWFNYIPTIQLLMNTDGGAFGLLSTWDKKRAIKVLTKHREKGNKVFTGAFIIKSPIGQPKIDGICQKIDDIWKQRAALVESIEGCDSLEAAWNIIRKLSYLGGFTAYEIVTDLRWTYMLKDAHDINTWANLGPGARRGMRRLSGKPLEKNKRGRTKNGVPAPKDWRVQIVSLHSTLNMLAKRYKMPRLEMREVEHSLCEFDKYERIRLNEGRSKRNYNGV